MTDTDRTLLEKAASTTRDEFEAWLDEPVDAYADGKPITRRMTLPDPVLAYADYGFSAGYLAARRAALLEAMTDLQKILEVAGQEDESGIVVAINALRALADEGMKP